MPPIPANVFKRGYASPFSSLIAVSLEDYAKEMTCLKNKTYRNRGVVRKFLPPKSIGYLNIKKKYRCPTRFPISSLMMLQGKKKDFNFRTCWFHETFQLFIVYPLQVSQALKPHLPSTPHPNNTFSSLLRATSLVNCIITINTSASDSNTLLPGLLQPAVNDTIPLTLALGNRLYSDQWLEQWSTPPEKLLLFPLHCLPSAVQNFS